MLPKSLTSLDAKVIFVLDPGQVDTALDQTILGFLFLVLPCLGAVPSELEGSLAEQKLAGFRGFV